MKKVLFILLFIPLVNCSDESDNNDNITQGETYFERLLEYSTYQVENSSNYYKFSSLTNQTDLTHEHYYLDSINQNCWLIEVYNGSFNETGDIRYEVDYGYDYLNYSQIFYLKLIKITTLYQKVLFLIYGLGTFLIPLN